MPSLFSLRLSLLKPNPRKEHHLTMLVIGVGQKMQHCLTRRFLQTRVLRILGCHRLHTTSWNLVRKRKPGVIQGGRARGQLWAERASVRALNSRATNLNKEQDLWSCSLQEDGGKEGEDQVALLRDCLTRQLREVEAVRSVYPDEFWMTDDETFSLELLHLWNQEAEPPPDLTLTFSVHLAATGDESCGRVSILISFPRHYPIEEPVSVTVECEARVSKNRRVLINSEAQAAADDMVGEEAVLLVLQRVRQLCSNSEDPVTSLPQLVSSHPSPTLERRSIYFHHIKSSLKKRCIKEWGAKLDLGGYCKPGFPGLLIFEGKAEDVAEFVRRIRKLKWQFMQIRATEQEEPTQGQDVDALRRFPLGIKELPETAMDELARRCRDAKLEHLLLTALKIFR